MSQSIFIVPVLLTSLVLWGSQSVVAQNGRSQSGKSANQAVQRAKEDVSSAEKAVRDAEKVARKASEKLKEAEHNQGKAANKIQKLRDELLTRYGESEGLPEKRRKLDEAKQAYQKASQPFLKQLAENDRYRDAVEEANDADKKLYALRTEKDNDDPKRLKLMSELAKAKLVPDQLQRETLESESSLDPLRQTLRDAEGTISKANDVVKSKVEKDPDLKAAQEAFQKSKADVLAARKDADDEGRHLARVRQKLEMETEALQRKINADLRDNTMNKKSRKKR